MKMLIKLRYVKKDILLNGVVEREMYKKRTKTNYAGKITFQNMLHLKTINKKISTYY